jgi:uncharacterized protein
MNYLDTSALIKRFVREVGSGAVDSLVTREGPVATSRIAYAEVFSALARRKREGDLSEQAYLVASRQVEAEWMALVLVDVTDNVLKSARRLVERYPLRDFDAIHVASALGLRKELGVELTFAAADRRQLEAARAEGLTVTNVEAKGR